MSFGHGPVVGSAAWPYPGDRYYYPWYDEPLTIAEPTDREMKSMIMTNFERTPTPEMTTFE